MALSPREYRLFEVSEMTRYSKDTIKIQCKIKNLLPLGIQPGQHAFLKATVKNESVTRAYTPIVDPKDHHNFDLLIKTYPGTLMNQFVHFINIGDSISIRGPIGDWVYRPNMSKRVLMLAAGSGVAPMVQIAKFVVDDDRDQTFLHLIYSAHSLEQIFLQDHLVELAEFWNFTYSCFISQEIAESKFKKKGNIVTGRRITFEDIKNQAKQPINQTLGLICGPAGFNLDMKKHLLQLGIPEDQMHIFDN